jgi:hypothetical protein
VARRWLALAAAWTGLVGARPVHAQPVLAPPAPPAPASAATPVPADGSQITVYLMTMGPGDAVWELFGHNAIWVQDRATGIDAAYNWGTFDFNQPNFLVRFLTGDTRYWVQAVDGPQMVAAYMEANRSVWLQELDLTPAQRVELRDHLEWNARPENMYYRYDYYRDNCSTRVRDVIDRALGGALERALGGVQTATTYRSHTRRLTADNVPVYTGIQLALGRPADRPISAWEEGFLPTRLMEHVRTISVTGADGATRPLVRTERALFTATREAEPARAPDYLVAFLVAGLALGGLLLVAGRAAASGGAGALVFTLLAGVWTLVVGLLGTALVLAGTVTRHVYMGHNVNVAVANPLFLALFGLMLVLFLSRRAATRAGRATWAARVATLVVVLALAGTVAMLLPAAGQQSWEIFALALPVHVALWMALVRLARSQRAAVSAPSRVP